MKIRRRPRQEAILSRLRGDRGDVVVATMVLPLAFLAVFGAFHFAFIYHGRNVASAAAQDAVHAAAQFGADGSDGDDAGKQILALWPALDGSTIRTVKGGDVVTATIQVKVKAPLPWLKEFEIVATGPTERFYVESERDAS